jgi:hypothetical protein
VLPGGEEPRDVRAERHERADGHPAAEALGQGDRVGGDPGLLEGEPRARAADTGLDLVDDEERTMGGRELPCQAQVCRARAQHARLALDGLEDDGRGVRVDSRPQRRLVPVRHVDHTGDQRLEGLAVGHLVGEGEGAGGAAVERPFGRHDAGPARAAGQLEGRLDRLGAGVGEEDGRAQRGSGDLEDPLGQLDLARGREEVGDVDRPGRLP